MEVGLADELWASIYVCLAKVSPGDIVKRNLDGSFTERVHAEEASHQSGMCVGSSPLDMDDCDGELDIWTGKERDDHVIDA